MVSPRQPAPGGRAEDAKAKVLDRSIGDLIRETRHLSDEQIEQILAHQHANGLRFGEAAVDLRLATSDDVVWALSQQFHYPYVPGQRPDNPELVVAANPFSDEAEVFRELRSQLMMGVMGGGEMRRALAVLSPNIGDGKTYLPPTWRWPSANWVGAPCWWMPTCARRASKTCLAWAA